MSTLAFILAEVIPVFNQVLSLTGSVCFGPIAMILPGWVWYVGHWHYRHGTLWQKTQWASHWFLILLGCLYLGGGTYGTVLEIIQAEKTARRYTLLLVSHIALPSLTYLQTAYFRAPTIQTRPDLSQLCRLAVTGSQLGRMRSTSWHIKRKDLTTWEIEGFHRKLFVACL